MPLPNTATHDFMDLLVAYKARKIEFPHLKQITFAQWALECGWGSTNLARHHKNYGGAKWRKYMEKYAIPVSYEAHDGRTNYCHFETYEDWIDGYWARFDLENMYKGWRNHVSTPEAFIKFIGPIWVGTTPEGKATYVRHVLKINQQIADMFVEKPNEVSEKPTDRSGAQPWDRVLKRDGT